jgi:bifunctional aspartokinase / homoserine dehydrogenase 1
MITMKFGGTSVGDIERLKEVVFIVRSHLPGPLVLVASAMSGVTNLLLDTAELAMRRDTDRVAENMSLLREKHFAVSDALVIPEERRARLVQRSARMLDELSNLYHGVGLLKELTVRSLDAIASFGEILSCMQIAEILNSEGIDSEFVDARKIIRTDARFGEASVDYAVTDKRIREVLLPIVNNQTVPVVTGFIAATEDGLTTTLGRSGSDYTASIVGAALNSEEIWIWTDVDGVMTADPRYVKGAMVLPGISYREAAEMSYFGAKVIHPKTMLPAIENNIPIRIKNTFNPSHPGTLISQATDSNERVVKNVTSIDNLSLVSIEGSGMVGVPGISARIFSALAHAQVNVMMISQASSEHNVCVVIPQRDCERAVRELRAEFEIDMARKAVDAVKFKNDISIVAVVGEGMRGTRGIAGKTFTAVAQAGVNIVAIAQGSSELNISLVVEQQEVRKAVQAVHDAFRLA